jgi:hypothetical protein
MSWEPGGYAEKLGHRYEGRWVARQLIRLLAEEICEVAIECVGDDEQGVDLWIRNRDGVRQAQQCKGRNASRETWSVGNLKDRGILTHARRQLERERTNEYALVSAVPAANLPDLCQSARLSSGDSEEFFLAQVQHIGEGRRQLFRQFCEANALDAESPDDRAIAYDLLRRIHFHLFADDQNGRDELRTWAGMLVAGEPDVVIAILADFASEHLRKPIHADEVRRHLEQSGHTCKQLVHDRRLGPALESLQQDFADSIAPYLIRHQIIHRDETEQILGALPNRTIVILHGDAGHGKTAVLFDLTSRLQENQMCFLPIRLDRKHPSTSTCQFGQQIGLPDSPTQCLAAIAAGRPAVLILDQLDALRWTSAHTSGALDVCKSLVREVEALRRLGKSISAVLCCRTFDLEHDPEIREWLASAGNDTSCRVEVKALSDGLVREVVGDRYDALSRRQQEILQSPQMLALWLELEQSEAIVDFSSATELMRKYWTDRCHAARRLGIAESELNMALDAIVKYMESEGRLSAPEGLLANRPATSDALQSLGIIRTASHQTSFRHQTFFDFLVADRVARELCQGDGSVLRWLGPRENQSLFRREQIRLLLSMLADEAPGQFVRAVRELLTDVNVRFHLKHLVLEMLGRIQRPVLTLFDFLVARVSDDYWRPHILGTVFWGHEPYVLELHKRGILADWLNSTDQEDINWALALLRSVNETCGALVAKLLTPLIGREGDWPRWILPTLPIGAVGECEELFELRLELARRGHAEPYVHWRKLAEENPRRVARLIEAGISTWKPLPHDPDELDTYMPTPSDRSGLERWTHEDLEAIKNAVQTNPEETWDLLIPHVERLTAIKLDRYDHRLDGWRELDELDEGAGYVRIPWAITAIVGEAGKRLAQTLPEAFLARSRLFQTSISKIVQRILLDVYTCLPAAHADEGIGWLLEDEQRLEIGSGYHEPPSIPAARMICALSPHCAADVFRELEKRITHYHSPSERLEAEYWLQESRHGRYGAWFGEAQYALLPALCPSRISPGTRGLIGVLERKFTGNPGMHFVRSGNTKFGRITSPLCLENLLDVSDNAWLRIIGNRKIPRERGGRWRQRCDDNIVETSADSFAQDLGQAARRQPERFAQLALRFPEDAPQVYIDAVLAAITCTQPLDVPEDEKPTWEPVRQETIEAVLEKFPPNESDKTAISFCRLMRNRADFTWSERSIRRLVGYAKAHIDPAPAKPGLGCHDPADDARGTLLHSLVEQGINCVRGVAAYAIAALLREHPDWLASLRRAVESLVGDPNVAVRVAAVEVCLAVSNIDKSLAVRWFCAACNGDLRVAASPRAVQLFNLAFKSDYESLAPIVLAMCDSDIDEVAQEGAEEVTARWLFHESFAANLDRCRMGRPALRKGVAQVSTHFLGEQTYYARCKDILLPLLTDPDADVRKEISRVFRRGEALKSQTLREFASIYVHSPAFTDDPNWLLRALEHYPGSLLDFGDVICDACERLVQAATEPARAQESHYHHSLWCLPPLLLRLYEQAQDQRDGGIQNRCLDAWDRLFESRVGVTRELTRAIDK